MGNEQSMRIIKNPIINTKNTKNIRKPFLNGDIPELIQTNKHLSNYHKFINYGSINFLSKTPIRDYTGLFSFVLYYRKDLENFYKSKYYIGLQIYAEIIHTNLFFENYGMVIYTDEHTVNILLNTFSFYDKVIIAVVDWPKFKIDDKIEDTVLRCLRFNALESFPNSNILIRDADTIFPTEIFSCDHAYEMGIKGTNLKGNLIEDYRILIIKKIGEWEKTFIKKMNEHRTPLIIVGTDLLYKKSWHCEFLFQINDRNIGNHFYHSEYIFESPIGVYAGFINFKIGRPDDIWIYSLDYIHNQYEIKDRKISDSKLNNESSKRIISIGKDEKIILFIIIVKYWYLCFFFTIYYTDDIEYYTNTNIQKMKNNVNIYDKCSINMNYHEILRFKDVSYKKKKNSTTYKNNIKVWTKILDPEFISLSYNKIINNKLIKSTRPSKKICGKIKESNNKKTFNEFLRENFKIFSKKYLEWLGNIKTKSIEQIKKELKILNKENKENNTVKDVINNIKFIYNSKLPQIEFIEDTSIQLPRSRL